MSITRNHIRLGLVTLCVILACISLFGCDRSNSNNSQYQWEVKLISGGKVMQTLYFDGPVGTRDGGKFYWHTEDNDRLGPNRCWSQGVIITKIPRESNLIEKIK